MTPSERRALLFLAAVALLGALVRAAGAWREDAGRPDGQQAALLAQQAAADSAAARGKGGRKGAAVRARKGDGGGAGGASSGPVAPVDVDRAGAAELDALPRIGPVLAARIVADRDSLGPFGSLDGLQRVRGIGPAMAASLAPHVTFSGTPRPSGAAPVRPSATARQRRPGSDGGRRAAPSSPRARGSRSQGASPASLPSPARPPATWPHRHPPPQSASATC